MKIKEQICYAYYCFYVGVYIFVVNLLIFFFTLERFGHTKVVNRNRNLKKNRKHTKKKGQKTIYKTLQRKLKIEQH
jgi:hypothetical protein